MDDQGTSRDRSTTPVKPPIDDSFRIRPATVNDIPMLAHHRRAMFIDIGHTDPAALDRMDAAFIPWATRQMARDDYAAVLAVTADDVIVAGTDIWFMPWPPGPTDASGRHAYILNVYTDPDYRQQGLARRLVGEAVAICRARGIIYVNLHARKFGHHLYETLGFTPTNEMRLVLE